MPTLINPEIFATQALGGETFGRYTLLEKIGQGGMAEVFRAKSFGAEGFEKILVIKRILPELANDPRFVEMFIREAKLAVRLSHVNVVQVFDLGRVQEALFIAMEYVHGVDLASLIAWAKKHAQVLSPNITAYIASEVAKGLDYAHRRRDEQQRSLGIVHCDVSPHNILLSFEGEVKVTDFGIAKMRGVFDNDEGHVTREDGRVTIRGKHTYLAPEQALGKPLDARSDIYSLGVVFYEMLAGSNPFSAPTVFETLRRVRLAEAPPLELARPDIPSKIISIVRKAMAASPDARYVDAAHMHDDLLAFLYGSGERFGAHTLRQLLMQIRQTSFEQEVSKIASTIEEQWVRTPIEIPNTKTPTPSGYDSAQVPIVVEAPTSGFGRAVSLGEQRDVTLLQIEFSTSIEKPSSRSTEISELRRWVAISGNLPSSSNLALGDIQRWIESYGGKVLESDAYHVTAIFGLTFPDGRDTDIAVRCASVLLRALYDMAPMIGIGIHAGKITIDSQGEWLHDQQYDELLSAAHHLASARTGRLGISAEAFQHVSNLIDVEPMTNPPETFAALGGLFVQGRKPTASRYGCFVGRYEELKVIGEFFAAATQNKAKLILIKGVSGIGKTRLLYEIERKLRRGSYDVGWYLTSCLPPTRDLPLSGVSSFLRVLCGIEEGDAETKLFSVRPRLRALGLNEDEQRVVLELIREGGDIGRSGVGSPLQASAEAALIRMISHLCEDRLQVFACDDAQDCDAQSLNAFATIIRALASCRVVFLFATQEQLKEEATWLSFIQQTQTITPHTLYFGELSTQEVQTLLLHQLNVQELEPELVAFIHEHAGGNPLFIEELLYTMQNAGAIARETVPTAIDDGSIHDVRAVLHSTREPIHIPKSLRGLVASRLANFSPRERTLLATIAIQGEPAEIDLLALSASDTVASIERMLGPLERAGFLRHVGERGLAFTSPVVRSVVLDRVPDEAKREIHLVLAAALLTQSTLHHDRIAHHLLNGGELEHAAEHFACSGEWLLSIGRHEGAVSDFIQALELVHLRTHSVEEIASWLRALAAAMHTAGGSGQGRELTHIEQAVERALQYIASVPNGFLQCNALIDAGRIFGIISNFDRANESFEQAERLSNHHSLTLRRVLMARAETAKRSGNFGEAVRLLSQLETMLQKEPRDRAALYEIYIGLAPSLAVVGGRASRDRALYYLERAEKLTRKIGDSPARAAEREKARAFIYFFVRDFSAAALCSERASSLYRSAGLFQESATNLHNLGDAHIRLKEYPKAYAALRQSLTLAEEGRYERLIALDRILLAYLDGLTGDTMAQQTLEEMLSWGRSQGFVWDEINARYWLGMLYLSKGLAANAIAELMHTRMLAEQLSMRTTITDCDEAIVQAQKIRNEMQ